MSSVYDSGKFQSRSLNFNSNERVLGCEQTKQSAKDMFRGLRKVELAFKGAECCI